MPGLIAERSQCKQSAVNWRNYGKNNLQPAALANVKVPKHVYRKHLNHHRTRHFKEAVEAAKGDPRQLFSVTQGLMGKDSENPLPMATSPQEFFRTED